jgi:chemotaxis signal transduction protein
VKTSASTDEKLALLRRDFDQAFSRSPSVSVDGHADFLAVRVAGDPYAFRVREIRGLVPSRKIVPLPSRRPELLGLAGHRGALVMVYGLGALLGYSGDVGATPWLALVGASSSIGLAFEQFEGFFRVRSVDRYGTLEVAAKPGQPRDVVRVGDVSRPVIDLPSMLGTLDIRAEATGPTEESQLE